MGSAFQKPFVLRWFALLKFNNLLFCTAFRSRFGPFPKTIGFELLFGAELQKPICYVMVAGSAVQKHMFCNAFLEEVRRESQGPLEPLGARWKPPPATPLGRASLLHS